MRVDTDPLSQAIASTLRWHGTFSQVQATIIADRVANAAGEDAKCILLGLLRGHVDDPRIQNERAYTVELYKHAMLWTDGNEDLALEIVLAAPIFSPELQKQRKAIRKDMVEVWKEHGAHTYSDVIARHREDAK